MKDNQYIIEIAGLKLGQHHFERQLDASLFDERNPELLQGAHLVLHVNLSKSDTMIEANISLNGYVDLICDRTLEPFQEPFEAEERMFFKFGEEAKELSEDVQVIPYNAETLDLGQLVYDLVSVGLPIKRLHPDCRDEEEWAFVVNSETAEADNAPEKVDPRWEALKQLKFGDEG